MQRVTLSRADDHISPVLRHLHWLPLSLPVWQRVIYKIVTLVHRRLSGHVPSYLADDCRLVTDAGIRRLRSADTQTLVIGRTRSSFGGRAFAAAAPRLWNSLPSDIRQPMVSLGGHLRHFWAVGPRRSATCDNCALETLLLTYLLTYLQQ